MAITFARELDRKVTNESFANRNTEAITRRFRAQADYHLLKNKTIDGAAQTAISRTDRAYQAGQYEHGDKEGQKAETLRLTTNNHASLSQQMNARAQASEMREKQQRAVVTEERRREAPKARHGIAKPRLAA